jgi:hypothetical protein
LEGLSEDIGEVDGGLFQNREHCERAGVRRKEGRKRGNNLKIARHPCFVCQSLALPVLSALLVQALQVHSAMEAAGGRQTRTMFR